VIGMIEAALFGAVLVHERGRQAVASSLGQERRLFYDERDRTHAIRAERSRWFEEHDASGSFPCGVIRPIPARPDAPAVPTIHLPREVPVVAAIVPAGFTFLVDPPDGYPSQAPIEAGSIARKELASVAVVDDAGAPVARPLAESFDDEPDVHLVLRFGSDGEQRLTFRSAWLAWQASDRFLAAAVV
jgi:hypothetical protein